MRGINTYSYVEGNPLSGTDPDGTAPKWIDIVRLVLEIYRGAAGGGATPDPRDDPRPPQRQERPHKEEKEEDKSDKGGTGDRKRGGKGPLPGRGGKVGLPLHIPLPAMLLPRGQQALLCQ